MDPATDGVTRLQRDRLAPSLSVTQHEARRELYFLRLGFLMAIRFASRKLHDVFVSRADPKDVAGLKHSFRHVSAIDLCLGDVSKITDRPGARLEDDLAVDRRYRHRFDPDIAVPMAANEDAVLGDSNDLVCAAPPQFTQQLLSRKVIDHRRNLRNGRETKYGGPDTSPRVYSTGVSAKMCAFSVATLNVGDNHALKGVYRECHCRLVLGA